MGEGGLIELFVAPLNELGIKYMITGSVASGIYGSPRYTNDVDLVIAIDDAEVELLHRTFDTPGYYVPPVEVISVERNRKSNGHFNIIHIDSGFKADLFFPGNNRLIRWGLENRRAIQTKDDKTLWMAPIEYVILLKLLYMRDSGSSKHVDDIRSILQTQRDSVDYELLQREAESLGLSGMWNEVAQID